MAPDESHDGGCEDRTDPSSWDDPDISFAWDEPPVIEPEDPDVAE